ncbi:hypothetical protein AB3X52_11570 [Nocardioides sp. DS6]|uniref:Zinc ribbon domain-containing protein n=1 Tax=Nocardioides eburneus TaxID=3231482 RepID=A0ABV3SZ81_9ACTN
MSTGRTTHQQRGQRCAACGHEAWPGDAFCTGCGVALDPAVVHRPLFADELHSPDPAPDSPAAAPVATGAAVSAAPGRRRGGLALAVVVVLLLVAAGIGYVVGHRGEDARPTASRPGDVSRTGDVSRPAGEASTRATQPQDELQQVSRRDEARARRLVGSWVPQLAALAAGAGPDASWAQALAHYQRLIASYPSALLLDTGRWPHSYERGGLYAVIVPQPGRTSRPALAWCAAHVRNTPQDCAAKLISTTGSWADNFDTGAPGPG